MYRNDFAAMFVHVHTLTQCICSYNSACLMYILFRCDIQTSILLIPRFILDLVSVGRMT